MQEEAGEAHQTDTRDGQYEAHLSRVIRIFHENQNHSDSPAMPAYGAGKVILSDLENQAFRDVQTCQFYCGRSLKAQRWK